MDGWVVGPDGCPGQIWRACLADACAAPSVHNTQPWRFRLADGHVDVIADDQRRLDVIDPIGREMLISVGAAVLNLRIAVLHRGRLPIVQPFPDPEHPAVAARVRLGPPVRPPAAASQLALAIPRRHSNRQPFWSTRVAPKALAELEAAARTEGAYLAIASPDVRDAVLDVIRAAEHRWQADQSYARELHCWTRDPGARLDGVPPQAFGPWDKLELMPVRDFGLTVPTPRRKPARYEAEPTLMILSTFGDDRAEWLRAGIALEHVLLRATALGLSTTMMTQALEVPRLRDLLDDSARRRAQVVVRCGYGPPAAATPRRAVDDVLDLTAVR